MKEKGGKKKKGKKGKGKVADEDEEEEASPEPGAPAEDLESKKPVEVTAEDLADEEWGPANEKSKGKKGKKGKKEEPGMHVFFTEDLHTIHHEMNIASVPMEEPTQETPKDDEDEPVDEPGAKVLSKKEKEKLKKEREKVCGSFAFTGSSKFTIFRRRRKRLKQLQRKLLLMIPEVTVRLPRLPLHLQPRSRGRRMRRMEGLLPVVKPTKRRRRRKPKRRMSQPLHLQERRRPLRA